jgi:hypothetical protein
MVVIFCCSCCPTEDPSPERRRYVDVRHRCPTSQVAIPEPRVCFDRIFVGSGVSVKACWLRCWFRWCSSIGLGAGTGVFDDRDVNVSMADTKQNRKTKKASTKHPEALIEGRSGLNM